MSTLYCFSLFSSVVRMQFRLARPAYLSQISQMTQILGWRGGLAPCDRSGDRRRSGSRAGISSNRCGSVEKSSNIIMEKHKNVNCPRIIVGLRSWWYSIASCLSGVWFFYRAGSSNAAAESFNAKIKLFRANIRGVADKKFVLFRIAKLYA